MPANIAEIDVKKLAENELADTLEGVQARAQELYNLDERDEEQESELLDAIEKAEQIGDRITNKAKQELAARMKRLGQIDPVAKRKSGNNRTQPETISCLGERLALIAKGRITGHYDSRLYNALGQNEGVPSEGGFLVGNDNELDLSSKMYGDSIILNSVQRTPISSSSNMLRLKLLKENSRADGSRSGGVLAYWEGEAESTTATKPTYDEFELYLRKLMATSYASNELLEDFSALEAETSAEYLEEMTFKMENAIINGDGVGKPKGILSSAAKIAVALETGQTTSDPLNYENICKMWARLHPRSQQSAIWLVDQTLIPYLFTMGLANGTAGTPVYLPPGGASGSPYGTIFGRPVAHTEHTQAANTEGDIILWDPKSYRVIEKGGVKSASSMHVAFLTDEMAFRWTYRVNGAPKWYSALTPKNGGSTLSTIVTLTTRT